MQRGEAQPGRPGGQHMEQIAELPAPAGELAVRVLGVNGALRGTALGGERVGPGKGFGTVDAELKGTAGGETEGGLGEGGDGGGA